MADVAPLGDHVARLIEKLAAGERAWRPAELRALIAEIRAGDPDAMVEAFETARRRAEPAHFEPVYLKVLREARKARLGPKDFIRHFDAALGAHAPPAEDRAARGSIKRFVEALAGRLDETAIIAAAAGVARAHSEYYAT